MKTNPNEEVQSSETAALRADHTTLKKWLIVAAVAVVMIATAITILIIGNIPEKRILAYYKAVGEKDVDTMISLRYPEPMLKHLDEKEIRETLKTKDIPQYEAICKEDYTFEIRGVTDLEDEALEQAQKYYKKKFGMQVPEVKTIKVRWKVEGVDDFNPELEIPKPVEVKWTAYKYKGEWYLDDVTKFE